MNNQNNIVFGTGPLGLWVAQVLAGQGKQVTVVNRSGKAPSEISGKIKVIAGDANDSTVVYEICKGANSVFHCAMPPYTQWPEKFPPLTKGILNGVKQAGCRLIYGDNLYGYGDTKGAPVSEQLPYKATGHKGKARASMAEMLLNERDLEVAIGRGSDFYGPLVTNSVLGEMFFKAALSGKPVNLLGNVDLPHTYTYIKDFAVALIKLSDHQESFGQVWHVPNAPTITTRELVSIVEKQIDQAVKIRAAGKWMVSLLGLFNPMLKEMKEMMYEWEQPYLVEHKKYENKFGNNSTPHDVAIKETIEWYLEDITV
jgi:nucleoside-diphosphate-sugar epimerase